jgi:hypothetical protein
MIWLADSTTLKEMSVDEMIIDKMSDNEMIVVDKMFLMKSLLR